jgi:hypothetical protein
MMVELAGRQQQQQQEKTTENFENGIIPELKPRIKKQSKIRKLKWDPLYTFHYYFTNNILQYF